MNQLRSEPHGRSRFGAVTLLTLGFLIFAFQPHPQATSSSSKPIEKSHSLDSTKLKQLLADLPLAFELNKGQADRNVKFLARGPRAQLLLGSSRATLVTASGRFGLRFAGANSAVNLTGADQLI